MWLFLVETGFVGFVASLFAFVWRGLRPDGGARRSAALWLLLAAVFFALLVIALPKVPAPLH